MDEKDRVRLQHILEAAKDAIAFSQGKDRNALDTDKMLRFSLERCIEIIGEAASKISKECQNEYPHVPWNKITNMRNRLIHAYYDINLDILWSTVSKDLPPLIVQLEKIISQNE